MKIFSILVDELPKCCKDCDLYDSEEYICMATFEDIDLWKVKDERHANCPLRQVWMASYHENGIIKP